MLKEKKRLMQIDSPCSQWHWNRYPQRRDAGELHGRRCQNQVLTEIQVWATETAAHTSRGQFVAIEFTLNIFGVVVAYWLQL